MRRAILAAAFASVLAADAAAGDLFRDEVATILRTETLSIEALAGYVTATSTEYVYDVGRGGAKLSQLNWDISNALALGGRVAFKPADWLTLRVRGWATVAADSEMKDYDWLAGYQGFKSFTHISSHPDTVVPSAWQGDASLAATVWQDESIALSVLGGVRHYEAKFEARGGSYLYSSQRFFDTAGTFPAGQPVGTYKQTWDAAYLGIGVSYAAGPWGLTGEAIGGPAIATADDQHLLRTLRIKSKLDPSAMFGLAGALEYRVSDHLSLVGRLEYQHFLEAKGSARYADYATGDVFTNPKPGSGADADTLLLSIGVKARL